MSAARPIMPQRGGPRPRPAPRYPESRKRQFAVWWREVDRTLLMLIALLMAVGAVAVGAASPASARRLSTSAAQLHDLHFLWLHLRWMALGLVVMLATALLPRESARRGSLILAGVMFAGLLLVPILGTEVNGARRWLDIGLSLQPSEFLKPAFAVTIGWILSWRLRDPGLPVIAISACFMASIVALLMLQPDLGASVLFCAVWLVMVLVAGLPVRGVLYLSGFGLTALTLAYLLYDNAQHRIDSFIGGGTAYDQVDLASRTLTGGGWTGTGVWLGQRKMQLPEAHTDYIFSVIGEEFGLLLCAVVVLLYLAIVLRVLVRLVQEDNQFIILSASGLIALFGGQAFINILVNLQLFPSKGMTLPLISYGGSSFVAQCFTIGLLLAITRRNPYLEREKFDLRSALEKEQAP